MAAPLLLRPTLTAYAVTHLGRAIDASDPEIDELEEALARQIFKLGGRTNPSGYYLDVIITGYPGTTLKARLKSPNDLMRMNLDKEYRSYRNDWYRMLNAAIERHRRPPAPLKHARVMFQVFSPRAEKHMLDAEAKYSAINPLLAGLHNSAQKFTAVKPLLDSMQQNTTFSGSGKETVRQGVGIILDDTDGEHFREGVIKQLEVLQRRSKDYKVRITIEEATPWP